MATLSSLPEDVSILILTALTSPRDLHPLIAASPEFLRVFLCNRDHVLRSLLQSTLMPDALPHALAILRIPPIKAIADPPTEPAPEAPGAIASLELYFANDLSLEIPTDTAGLTALFGLHVLVAQFVDEYVLHATRQMGLEVGSNEFPALSRTERTRLQRAFFRYELYCRVFGPAPKDFPLWAPLEIFIYKLEVWEFEEMISVHTYLSCLIREVVQDLEEQVVQAALAAPGARKLDKSHPDFVELQPYPPETSERYARGVMTWGRLADGSPAPLQRHPPPTGWNSSEVTDEGLDTWGTGGHAQHATPFDSLGTYGMHLFDDNFYRGAEDFQYRGLKELIGTLASSRLRHTEGLLRGDDEQRMGPLRASYGTRFEGFAQALDYWMSMVQPKDLPDDDGLNLVDDPSRQNTGYRTFWLGNPWEVYYNDRARCLLNDALREKGCVFWDARRIVPQTRVRQSLDETKAVAPGYRRYIGKKRGNSVQKRLSGLLMPREEMVRLGERFGDGGGEVHM